MDVIVGEVVCDVLQEYGHDGGGVVKGSSLGFVFEPFP